MNPNASEISVKSQSLALSTLMTKVYLWMTLALGITALSAMFVASNLSWVEAIFGNDVLLWGILIAQIAIVITLDSRIDRLSFLIAGLLFGLYALLNGVILSCIFLVFKMDVITQAFVATTGTFGAMSLIGTFIKKDLSAIGRFCFMALIGLIVATIVNIFWTNDTLYWAITYLGVLIFCGLTAYDTQKIRGMMIECSAPDHYEVGMKLALLGSLALYLDFVNIFLYLVRLFGRRR